MRLKHKANIKASEVENGKVISQKKGTSATSMWVENETDGLLMSTRELNSLLANRSDASLADAAVESEQAVEAEIIVEKLRVKNHELDWYQEDNDSNFLQGEFTSEFASTLRRESIENQPSRKQLAKLHNDMIKSLDYRFELGGQNPQISR